MKTKNVNLSEIPKSIRERKINTGYAQAIIDSFSFEYRESITTFCDVLKRRMPYANLNTFYHNLETLSISQARNPLWVFRFITSCEVAAEYIWNNRMNEIRVYRGPIKASVYHELFHMSSTKKLGTFDFSGFMQEKFGEKQFTIGRGLNEGYTDLLSERYFTLYGAETDGYLLLKHIAKTMELIIGQFDMECLYFESDLYSLVEKLEQYASYEEVIALLKEIDLLYKYAGLKDLYHTQNFTKKIYRDVMCKLYTWGLAKVFIEYENEAQNYAECIAMINKLLIMLGQELKFKNIKYSGCSDDELVTLQDEARETLNSTTIPQNKLLFI